MAVLGCFPEMIFGLWPIGWRSQTTGVEEDMTKLSKSVPAGFGPKGLARTEDKSAAMIDGVR